VLDLHCHILPGVDDGAASLAEAMAMARWFVHDGITHVTATPHCHRYTRLMRADVLPHVARLNEELSRADVPLTVLPGSEIQATDSAQYRREFAAGLYCHLGDGPDFTLLEFPWRDNLYPSDAPDLVKWVRDRGMTPVVAHPERHNYFRDHPGRLEALLGAGVILQVTVDSLLGNHGPMPLTQGEVILRTYPDVVLATDSHNLQRCSGLSRGYDWVRREIGPERADDLRARSDAILTRLLGRAVNGGAAPC
jgi:protein-tyrosine phosphatase